MASSEQGTLFETFRAAAGPPYSSTADIFRSESDIATTLSQLVDQVSQFPSGGTQAGGFSARDIVGGQMSDVGSAASNIVDMSAEAGGRLNTAPTTEQVQSRSSTAEGGSNSALSVMSGILGGGLGVIPLVSGLLGLFGGGSSQPPPLEKYVQPDRLYFSGADTAAGIEDADFDQYGMPRLYNSATAGTASQTASSNSAPLTAASPAGTGTPINVTIQALDSQSFLDRSSDIAQAVRQAMLNSSSINDVVSDL
ncbi:MAG: hypothetical protein JO099_18775 [Acidobacteriia bacterium]|nr:hypothetical protein [Terriglobia bacterium]